MSVNRPYPSGAAERFPYDELLAFYRGELDGTNAQTRIAKLIEDDPHWRAQWESVRFLDLEQAAAIQDGKDLRRFAKRVARGGRRNDIDYCLAVAATNGKLFLRHALRRKRHPADRWTPGEWARHVHRCVYCRRMLRGAYAVAERRAAGLPPKEPLLREWLLRPYYRDALKKAHRQLLTIVHEPQIPAPSAAGAADAVDAGTMTAPQTHRVTVIMDARRFVGVANGHVTPVQTVRSGQCGRLSWKLLGPARARSHMGPKAQLQGSTLSGISEGLEFTRELGASLGLLKVVVRLEEGDTVSCDTSLKRPENEPEPRKELTLKVTYRHALVSEDHGSDQVLRVIGRLSDAPNVPGSDLCVSVLEGTGPDAQLLEKATFQFRDRSHLPPEETGTP